jgi:hypothetical protein
MSRSLVLIALGLVLLAAGCTRYSRNPPAGPFARKPKPNLDALAPVPPGPPANTSPLAIATPTQPEPVARPAAPDQFVVVPPRPPEPPAPGAVTPAGGVDDAAIPPLLPRRRAQPEQMPSPFAKEQPGLPMPVAPSPTARHVAEVKKLAATAAEKWAKVDSYEAVVTRRELAPNKEMSEDTVLYQFRKEPTAVYIKNLGESGKGREILYNPRQHGDKIYAVIGEGDSRFLKPGTKAPAVSPDMPMVKEKSRYSIREAGYGTPIARVAGWAAKTEAGKIPAENLTYLGEVTRKEYPYPLLGVQLKLRPGDEALMPNGGTRQWYFDPKPESPSFGFPVLIIATEPSGKEVEYYLFEKIKMNVKFTDADFSPDRMGKK